MGAGPRPLEVPLSEVIGALSYALDLTEGEPPGHAVRTCMIGMRLAQELGLGEADRSDLFYALLLKDAGCSANSARMAALFAVDDRRAKRSSKRVDWSRSYTRVPVDAADGRARRVAALARGAADVAPRGDRDHALADARPLRARGGDRAAARARAGHGGGDPRRSTSTGTATASPRGCAATRSRSAARILCLAQTVEIFHAARGLDAALRVAARRSGGWFDPRLVAALRAHARRRRVLALAAGRRARAVGAARSGG